MYPLFSAMNQTSFQKNFERDRNNSGPPVDVVMVYNVFDVWSRNYHLLAIRLPRIKNTCTMIGKYVVKGKKLRLEKSLAQMKEHGKCKKMSHH